MSRGRILVVDDDAYIQGLVAVILERQCYEVSAAVTGIQAIGAVQSTPIDVILLDTHMPDVDGPAFVQLMHQGGLKLPVIAMSGSMGVPRWAADVNAVGFLTKPFTMSQLIMAVEDARRLTKSLSGVAV